MSVETANDESGRTEIVYNEEEKKEKVDTENDQNSTASSLGITFSSLNMHFSIVCIFITQIQKVSLCRGQN